MKIQERSYSSKIMRPKPHLHIEGDGSLIVIATSWGQADHARIAAEEVSKYVNAAKADMEVTSHFEFMTCLSDETNYVRTGVLVANEALYRGQNRRSFASGVEILALLHKGSQLAWAHVGAPSLLIQRKNQSLQGLSMAQDLSQEFPTREEALPCLPAQFLGLDPTCDVHCGHTSLQEGDQLVLLASSLVAPSLWTSGGQSLDLTTITNRMIQEAPTSPFWLGLISA